MQIGLKLADKKHLNEIKKYCSYKKSENWIHISATYWMPFTENVFLVFEKSPKSDFVATLCYPGFALPKYITCMYFMPIYSNVGHAEVS